MDFQVTYAAGRLYTSTFVKPGAKWGLPLCPSSAHHPSVHRAWPHASLINSYAVASTPDSRVDAYRYFFERFTFNFICPPLLPLPNVERTLGRESEELPCNNSSVWIPLPFHPLIFRDVNRMVAELNADPAIAELYSMAFGSNDAPRVRIAWRNFLVAHQFRIRAAARATLTYGRGLG